MTVLDEFFDSYLHYSVSQRLFEDRCRQLTECRGSVEERQALVDETLRLATCVSGNANDTESLIADTVEFIQNNGGDPDLLEAISLITNNLKEDRERADDYNISVSGLRIGNTARRPRRPQVANPFVYVPEEESDNDDGTKSGTSNITTMWGVVTADVYVKTEGGDTITTYLYKDLVPVKVSITGVSDGYNMDMTLTFSEFVIDGEALDSLEKLDKAIKELS